MAEAPSDDLIDRIYEAAVAPDRWPGVLDDICSISGGFGAALFVTNEHSVTKWVTTAPLAPIMNDWVEGRWQERTQRTPRMFALKHAGFVREADVFLPGEIEEEPSIVSFFRPRGLGWGAGAFVPMPSGDAAVYSIERRYEFGPVTDSKVARLDALRPHLARVALMSARLGLERLNSAMAILDAIGLPAAILRSNGRVLIANRKLEGLSRQIITAGGALGFAAPRAQSLYKAALEGLAQNASVRSIPVPPVEDEPALIIHILPLRRSAQDIFNHAASLVLVTPLSAPKLPNASLLQGLFDLTAAEARVAGLIAEGATIDNAAKTQGVARETIRSHLKAIFLKTGTKRQAELVKLLVGASTRF